MESFQNDGDWWIPGTNQRVSGKVYFSPTEGVELELNGQLPTESDEPEQCPESNLTREIPRIYGNLGRDGRVTVTDAVRTSASLQGASEVSGEDYFAKQLVMGAHLSTESTFERMSFAVDEIPAWSNASTIRPIIDTEPVAEATETDNLESVYVTTEPVEYTAEFEDFQIEIFNGTTVSSEMHSTELETVGVLNIIPGDEATLSRLFDLGIHAVEYLSLAVGTGVYPDELHVYTESTDRPLDVFRLLPDYTEDRASSAVDYLFRPENVEFGSSLSQWIEHRRQAPEVHENYRLLLHRSNLSPRLRFLTVVIALEAYYDVKYPSSTLVPEDRFDEIKSDVMEVVPDQSDLQGQLHGLFKHVVNTPSIKDKLEELMRSEEALIGEFFDISDLASEARDHRNGVAHGSIETSPQHFQQLALQLQLVLEALLGREIGVSQEVLMTTLANRHQGLLRQMDHIDLS
jgi:hypothetical protein